jgi:hypothetical protein
MNDPVNVTIRRIIDSEGCQEDASDRDRCNADGGHARLLEATRQCDPYQIN